jgi:hypothetical protein
LKLQRPTPEEQKRLEAAGGGIPGVPWQVTLKATPEERIKLRAEADERRRQDELDAAATLSKARSVGAMTKHHPQWDEFCDRLEGPDGVNPQPGPRTNPDGTVSEGWSWTCAGGNDKSLASRILIAMGFTNEQVAASLAYFESKGGFCDCEILFNVAE